MSYYQRPMGDYKTYGYAGDPGFLSSLWKGIKSVGKTLFSTAVEVSRAAPEGQLLPSFPGVGMGPQASGAKPQMYLPAFPGQGRLPPYTATGPGVLPMGGRTGQMMPQGYHLDKRTRTRLVRNRRMNIANPRALRRAMRRVQGFEKLAKRTISFTRRVKMKKRSS